MSDERVDMSPWINRPCRYCGHKIVDTGEGVSWRTEGRVFWAHDHCIDTDPLYHMHKKIYGTTYTPDCVADKGVF